MRRRAFIALVGGAAAAWPLAARAQQQTARVYRIGILWVTAARDSARLEYLRSGLRELGYTEGNNLVLLDRSPRQSVHSPDWMVAVSELVQEKVDVIVTAGTTTTIAAQRAAGSVPVVMTFVSDPIGSGFIDSLARPGGNITGLTNFGPELSTKWLELMKELAPATARIAILHDSAVRPAVDGMKSAAALAGVTLEPIETTNESQVQSWLAAPLKPNIDALIVFLPARNADEQSRIIQFAAAHRLPAIYWWREYVDGGGLIYYGPSVQDMYRHAAVFVDKILKGAKPADLPVQQPTKFELVINLKTAKALGLKIPPTLLARADEVIE
jgi:putative tryptophan/tyrosine transport system substrate-binding protein